MMRTSSGRGCGRMVAGNAQTVMGPLVHVSGTLVCKDSKSFGWVPKGLMEILWVVVGQGYGFVVDGRSLTWKS